MSTCRALYSPLRLYCFHPEEPVKEENEKNMENSPNAGTPLLMGIHARFSRFLEG
jgi:hypothetical protein